MQTIQDIREAFVKKYLDNDFVIDKSGQKVIELIGGSFIADDETIFGKPNYEYIARELEWYLGMSLNVNDIPGKVPNIWKEVATEDGFINSNYGYLVFHEDNGYQFDHVVEELMNNPDSRRAQMIYTRPSIWEDYNWHGMSDFICTDAVQYFIRKNRLIVNVRMRSGDAWAGFRNDFAWQREVQQMVFERLRHVKYPELQLGEIIWTVGSLHLYERQFYLIEHYIHTGEYLVDRSEIKLNEVSS